MSMKYFKAELESKSVQSNKRVRTTKYMISNDQKEAKRYAMIQNIRSIGGDYADIYPKVDEYVNGYCLNVEFDDIQYSVHSCTELKPMSYQDRDGNIAKALIEASNIDNSTGMFRLEDEEPFLINTIQSAFNRLIRDQYVAWAKSEYEAQKIVLIDLCDAPPEKDSDEYQEFLKNVDTALAEKGPMHLAMYNSGELSKICKSTKLSMVKAFHDVPDAPRIEAVIVKSDDIAWHHKEYQIYDQTKFETKPMDLLRFVSTTNKKYNIMGSDTSPDSRGLNEFHSRPYSLSQCAMPWFAYSDIDASKLYLR